MFLLFCYQKILNRKKVTHNKINFFSTLPLDLWKDVFLFLENAKEFSSVSQVCKTWHTAVYDLKFLQKLVKFHFKYQENSLKIRDYTELFVYGKKFVNFEDIPWKCVTCNKIPRKGSSQKITDEFPNFLEKVKYYLYYIAPFRNKVPFHEEIFVFWCGCTNIGNSFG